MPFASTLVQSITESHFVVGNVDNIEILNLNNPTDADEHSLIWISPSRNDKLSLIKNTKAKFIVCDKSLLASCAEISDKCFVIVANPKRVFTELASSFFSSPVKYGRSPLSAIHDEAVIHPNTYIGPFSQIGKAIIGERSVIIGNCVISDGVVIGKNVTIHAGCVIGKDGFGYLSDSQGSLVNFPHLGQVIIEDDVVIGANTCIDRGALGPTVIGQGSKIDNLVHIAHNVKIGRNAMIVANSVISGSCRLGDNCYIAPSAALIDQISVGNNAKVGIGAIVTKEMADNEVWTGNPAIPLKKYAKQQKYLNEIGQAR